MLLQNNQWDKYLMKAEYHSSTQLKSNSLLREIMKMSHSLWPSLPPPLHLNLVLSEITMILCVELILLRQDELLPQLRFPLIWLKENFCMMWFKNVLFL